MNLNDWTLLATQEVMATLPSTGYDAALVLVYSWLTDNTWVPEDEEDPAGEGAPTGDETPQEAAAEIVTQELANVVTLTVEVPVTITMSAGANFPSGTSESAILDDMKSLFESRLSSVDGVSFGDFDWDVVESSLRSGGSLDAADRVAVAAEVSAGGFLKDPASIATSRARAASGLDETWVAESVYVRADDGAPVVVAVRKYQSTTYVTLDSSVNYMYYVKLEPVTLVLWSIVKASV